MRLLLIHSDYIRFEVKKRAIKDADEITDNANEAEEALVAFIAVEKADGSDPGSVINRGADEIAGVFKEVNAKTIALYPYAHLSDSLSSPDIARKVLDGIYDRLKESHDVIKAPFGWYKAFEIRCKGHPLSELSRTILPEGVKEKRGRESLALKAEEKLESYWYVLDTNGKLIPSDEFNFRGHENLKKFADYEISKVRAVSEEPPHVKFMRSHEIADYEPGSDPGNLRWYPKGSLIKRLLEDKVSSAVASLGGMQVETPIMYDFTHPNLAKYLDRFPARQYVVKSGEKEYFLRFAACFGQYLMKHDMSISYRNLPLRLYELSHYSFRREQKGELVGLRRLRAFTMPDMHTLAGDMEQAKEEFLKQYKLSMQWMEDLDMGDNYEVGIRFVRDFYEKNEGFAKKLVELIGKPVLVEMWDSKPFYFVMKFEFNVIDALDKASALSTVQIDTENTERFDITYMNEDGREEYPLMLHASLSGSIDRNVYALLEKAYIDQARGKKPGLPLWLSPTQVRIIPVSDALTEYSLGVLEKMGDGVRADIDDRDESVSKKIRSAEREWVPYIVVVGEREKESGKLSVRTRQTGEQKTMDAGQLAREIKEKTKEMPFKPLPLPEKLSMRPKFFG